MTAGSEVGGAQRVLVLGNDDLAADLATGLEDDGLPVLRVDAAPVALATLDSVAVACLVVVDDGRTNPQDVFGAAVRNGHRVPGVFVGAEAVSLPPGVEQAPPSVSATTALVRQRLLSRAADDAEPVAAEDPLAAYGSTVAHELRNHLEAAGLAVESLDGDTKERAEAALERLGDLATEAEAVASGTVSQTTDVTISGAAGRAAERVHASNATVNIEADGAVEANEALLTLLFENLFRNAVEHVGTDVTVTVRRTDEGFAVLDDGPGFDSDRPFEWGYTTGSGQGAGLAVVRRIAQAHDWSVEASNDGGARIDVRVE